MQKRTRSSTVLTPATWFAVRVPALAADAAEHLENPIARALCSDVALAIAIASPDLFTAIQDPESSSRRVSYSAYRYLRRMSTRATPYGLFSGVGVGTFREQTTISTKGVSPRSTPDMHFLSLITDCAEQDVDALSTCMVLANPTVAVRNGRIKILGPRSSEVATRSLRAGHVLSEILRESRSPLPFGELVKLVQCCSPRTSTERARAFVAELIRFEVLLTDLRVPLTAEDPATHLADRLSSIQSSRLNELKQALHASLAICSDIDRGLSSAADALDRASRISQGLRLEPFPIRVDGVLELESDGLGKHVAEEAARAAELLLRLSPTPAGSPLISRAKERFLATYGPDRDVPLLQFIDDVKFPDVGQRRQDVSRDQRFIRLAAKALRSRLSVLELDALMLEELGAVSPEQLHVPASVELACYLCSSSREAIDSGNYLLVVSPIVGSRSAGRSTGRFARSLGDSAINELRAAARREQKDIGDDVIFAELICRPPHPRMANVSMRPIVREYELIVDGTPSVSAERVIRADDLVVSVRDNRFDLTWCLDGRRVIPCIGHMMNHADASPVAYFLSELSGDGAALLTRFDWGAAEVFPFLPRVTSGRTVLRPAQWRVSPSTLGADSIDRAWVEHDLPQRVYLAEGDQRILIDIGDSFQRDTLTRLSHRRAGDIVLHEALPDISDAWLPRSDDSRSFAEFVIPLFRASPVAPTASTRYLAIGDRERVKPPDSEWVYLKLYAAEFAQTALVREQILPYCHEKLNATDATLWFYLLYSDPESHVRVRLRSSNSASANALRENTCRWASQLLRSGLCLRVAIDTYEREVERYGGTDAMDIVEHIFWADSECTALLLGVSSEELRESMAVCALSDLLDAILGTERASEWLRRQRNRDPAIGARYRKRKDDLAAALLRHEGFGLLTTNLALRRDLLDNAGRSLRDMERRRVLSRDLESICGSLVHMFCNRMYPRDISAELLLIGLTARTRIALVESRRSANGVG